MAVWVLVPVPVLPVPVLTPAIVFVLVLPVAVPVPAPVLVTVFTVFVLEQGTFCGWPSEICWTRHSVLGGPDPVPMTVEIGVPSAVVVPSSTILSPVAVVGSDSV